MHKPEKRSHFTNSTESNSRHDDAASQQASFDAISDHIHKLRDHQRRLLDHYEALQEQTLTRGIQAYRR